MPENEQYLNESKEDFKDRQQQQTSAEADTTNWDNKPVSAEDAESFKKHLVKLYLVSPEVMQKKGWNEEVQAGWENYQELTEIGMPDSVKAVYAHRKSSKLPAQLMRTQYEGTSKIDEYKLWEKYQDDYFHIDRFGNEKRNYDILSDKEYEGVTGEKRIPKEYNIKDIIMNFMNRVK